MTKKKKYQKKKLKVPKGFAEATKNAIPLADIFSGKVSISGMLGGLKSSVNLKGANIGKGPGTHIPVKESGKMIGTMADGKKIWLKGPNKGQMVK